VGIGGETIDRDAAGNLVADKGGNRTFQYNDAGRLEEVVEDGKVVGEYRYDYQNRRVLKTVKKGTFVYHYDLAGQLLAETDSAGRLIRGYVWAEGEPLAQLSVPGSRPVQAQSNNGKGKALGQANGKQNKKTQLAYLNTDHLMTARLATDDAGTVLWEWDSTAFGFGLPNEDVDGDGDLTIVNLRFPGQYLDEATGFYYNWNRYYDPGTGRYITSDPIGLDGGLNTYIYVENNPLGLVDPLGLYGTTNCGYYAQQCEQIGGIYYCGIAPIVCNYWPEGKWSNCVRQCLQEFDNGYCETDNTCGGSDVKCVVNIHQMCWQECIDGGPPETYPALR
jgi:RHS repeat-associated protein